MRRCIVTLLVMVIAWESLSQVDEIKQASSEHSSAEKGGRRNNDSGGALAFDAITFAAQILIEAQRVKLESRNRNPEVVSVDVILQGAFQPSTYYILHPRVRGNWGLFSLDLRVNYLIEEAERGLIHIRTNDFQLVQLNLITHPAFNFRVGWGVMQEVYNHYRALNEWTVAARVSPQRFPVAIQTEFRQSEDVRSEVSLNVQYPIITKPRSKIFLTGGAVYQQYYTSINVWGMQAGLFLRAF